MRTNVVASLAVDGLHNWPDAKNVFPEVAFLSDLHRHMFHITCKKRVNHDDRNVEFIMLKRDVEDYLHQLYWDNESRCLVFDAMSCEMIARTLYEHFDLEYCSVFEDNENGAEVYE